MGLRKEDAIRVEHVTYSSKYHVNGLKQKSYIYICFICKENEVRVTSSRVKSSKGRCSHCALSHHYVEPFRTTYTGIRNNVNSNNKRKNKDRKLDITFEEFVEFTKMPDCHYCGIALEWAPYPKRGRGRSNLDRKQHDLNYSIDNIVVCCPECNYMKAAFYTYEEFCKMRLVLNQIRGLTLDTASSLVYPEFKEILLQEVPELSDYFETLRKEM